MLKKVKKSNAPSTKQPAGGGAAVKKRKASPPNSETVINERMSAPLESLAGTNEMSYPPWRDFNSAPAELVTN